MRINWISSLSIHFCMHVTIGTAVVTLQEQILGYSNLLLDLQKHLKQRQGNYSIKYMNRSRMASYTKMGIIIHVGLIIAKFPDDVLLGS